MQNLLQTLTHTHFPSVNERASTMNNWTRKVRCFPCLHTWVEHSNAEVLLQTFQYTLHSRSPRLSSNLFDLIHVLLSHISRAPTFQLFMFSLFSQSLPPAKESVLRHPGKVALEASTGKHLDTEIFRLFQQLFIHSSINCAEGRNVLR